MTDEIVPRKNVFRVGDGRTQIKHQDTEDAIRYMMYEFGKAMQKNLERALILGELTNKPKGK